LIVHLPLLEDALERVLQPWEEHPFEPITWYDMLNFSAASFFWSGSLLRGIKADCYVGAIVCPSNDEPLFALPKDLDDRARQKAIESLVEIEKSFRAIGLTISADTVKELDEEIKAGSRHSFEWLVNQIDSIQSLSFKELRGKYFFYIPPERIKFWPKQSAPFALGKSVDTSFPSATYDANQAGMSLAVGLGAACVFHLMRVLEIGLTALGDKFGVSLAHTNWAPAIEQIESKIREMHKDPNWKALPDCKDQQEFYAQAASHFAILKDAWRNHTMHVRGKYTEDEAERIFETVKAFMQKLSERLAEDELIPYGKH
jgi:hypothetical protein